MVPYRQAAPYLVVILHVATQAVLVNDVVVASPVQSIVQGFRIPIFGCRQIFSSTECRRLYGLDSPKCATSFEHMCTCVKYDTERAILFRYAESKLANFVSFSDTEKLICLLSEPAIVKETARFIARALLIRNSL